MPTPPYKPKKGHPLGRASASERARRVAVHDWYHPVTGIDQPSPVIRALINSNRKPKKR